MPLPPNFIPIYTRQPQVDPIYRRYGLDDMSSGVSAGAALEYAQKFSGGAALGRAAQLMEARGQTPTDPLADMPSPFAPGPTAAELLQQQQAAELMGEAPAPAVTPSAPVYPDVTMTPPKALSPLLQPEELNKRYGVEGRLKFDKPEYQEAAELLHDWAIDDVTREDRLARADQGLGSQAARLGAGLVGSMLDPLNVASAFVPVIPEAMFASAMAKAGGLGARAALRFGRGAAEGAVGAAALEPIVYYQSKAEQADYTLWDSLANVAFGTVLGGGLHVAAPAAGRLLGIGGRAVSSVADAVSWMRWSERAEILRGAVGQFVDRGEVRVDAAVPTRPWRETAGLSRADVEATARAVEATAAFKAWFGESKVVDEAGQPLRVYHGTNRVGEQMHPSRGDHDLGPGIYLTRDASVANYYSDRWGAMSGSEGVAEGAAVLPLHVSIRNPIYANEPIPAKVIQEAKKTQTDDTEWREVVEDAEKNGISISDIAMSDHEGRWFSAIKAAGYDGIIGKGPEAEVVAFRPEQVKSVFNEFPDAASPRLIDRASPEAQARIRAAAVRSSLAPSSETVADLHSAAVMADTVAKAPKADTAEQSIAAIQKDMATLDEQIMVAAAKPDALPYRTISNVEIGPKDKRPSLVVARKMPDGSVRYGQHGSVHVVLLNPGELRRSSKGIEDSMGWALPGGPFMTRQEALEWTRSQDPDFVEGQDASYGLEKRALDDRTEALKAEASAPGADVPRYADWLDPEDIAYLAEADDMIAQAAAKADVARVAALCGLGVG